MTSVDMLLRGCKILTMSQQGIIDDGALAIKNEKIVFVGKSADAENFRAERVIDAESKAALPGLINCHTHVPMTLFRGLGEDQPLDAWLKETIWPLEAKLKPQDVYAGALLGCLEMVRSGTTCFADMYFHEDMVAKAVAESGLRGVLAEAILETGHKLLGVKTFRDSVSFARKFRDYADGRVSAMLGPHAVYSCSEKLLAKVSKTASELNVGVHTHLSESEAPLADFRKRYRMTEAEFLERMGFLNNRVLAAHCINLSAEDRHILARRGVSVVHTPVSNMKLGSGAAKVKDLLNLGVNVALGTDGPASNNSLDMFETMKAAALLQKLAYRNPTVLPAYEVLKMATVNGAKALGLEKSIGSLEVGKKADIILLDLARPHLTPLHNLYAAIVYSARGGDVDAVIVDGKIIMENSRMTNLSEQTVTKRAEKAAFDLLFR